MWQKSETADRRSCSVTARLESDHNQVGMRLLDPRVSSLNSKISSPYDYLALALQSSHYDLACVVCLTVRLSRWRGLRRFLPVSQAGQLHIISGYAFAWLVLLHVVSHITGYITASGVGPDVWKAAGLNHMEGECWMRKGPMHFRRGGKMLDSTAHSFKSPCNTLAANSLGTSLKNPMRMSSNFQT